MPIPHQLFCGNHRIGPITAKGLREIVMKFEKIGSLSFLPGRKRKPGSAEILVSVVQVEENRELGRLLKFLGEVETDEDSDFNDEDNGPEGVLEENCSDHENFSEHDTESEEGGRHCFSTYQ
ncbi:hypothetical protein AVEN_62232-1 [Araneus ventricosus]|uniref:DUF4817 domain-containing protein n=1 Tax=Araneus ventricosus TaxID=182803 RepID=A0A4Y2NJZ7_ARAVE|nr:hypothetical protein AVEN_62232-1 [Araneus ventricosus]